MRFLISTYGESYVPFLAVCLRSLRLTHPGMLVHVLHDQRPEVIAPLAASNASATFEFLAEEAASRQNADERIASKIDYWLRGLEAAPDGEVVVFIDTDTIVRSSLAGVMPADVDVLLTFKDDAVPFNAGVVMIRASERTRQLMRAWRTRILEIFPDRPLFESAMEIAGAIDQYALLDILGVEKGKPAYGVWDAPGGIRVYGAHCSELNETRSVPLSSSAKILHRKFNKHRPKSVSLPMYNLWHEYLRAEERDIGRRLQPFKVRAKKAARRLGVPV